MKPARAELMAAVALLAPVMMAQQSPQTVVVQVHVTSVSGRDVYLDLGRTAGLAPGQTVRLYPSGTAEVQALIRTVSATSCRAELVPGSWHFSQATRACASTSGKMLCRNPGAERNFSTWPWHASQSTPNTPR